MKRKQPPKGVLYKDKRGEWRWRIVAQNGHKLANAGEGYTKRKHALMMLERAMNGFGAQHYIVK